VETRRVAGGAGLWGAIVLGVWLVALGASAEPRGARRPLLTNTQRGVIGADGTAQVGAATDDDPEAALRELRRRDTETERNLAQVQGGTPCADIRAASRLTLRTRLVDAHERELSVGVALLAAAGLLALFVRVPYARGLLTLPPLLGALYLGHHAYTRSDAARGAVLEGLRACTAELPAPSPRSTARVAERRQRADSLIATIRRVSADPELVPSRVDVAAR
jgi:hypothetical protein